MARPRTNHEHKKQELIMVAFKLFMIKGYENTSIQDIIKTAEISKGAMYHYFSSKEDILDDVLNYIIDSDIKRFTPLLNDSNHSALEKLTSLMSHEPSEIPEQVQEANEYIEARPVSIFDYRARELSKKRSMPVLTEIIKQGVESGEFHTQYPEEMTAFIYASGQEMETWFTNDLDKPAILEKVTTFIGLMEYCLGLNKEQYNFLLKFWEDQINKMY